MSAAPTPAELLATRRILVCVGTGGVGKTTLAAAMAVAGARAGRRTLVLTIDPARRLADALGVDELGNEPQELPSQRRQELSIAGSGSLSAMMLDMKRTFDDLVERFAESEESRQRILHNRIYLHVSDALAGSAEYAAMEKVFEIAQSDAFDLIVLDTPPSQHALDFLDAPQRLLEFLDSRLVQMLLHPAFAAGRFGFRLFHRAALRVFQIIERVAGIGFLEDISEFLLAFEGMSEGFRERARRVRTLLLGPETAFVLIAGPSPEAAQNAAEFFDRLDRSEVPVAGLIVNRARLWPDANGDLPTFEASDDLEEDVRTLAGALASPGSPPAESLRAARAAVEVATGYASLVRLDLRSTANLRERASLRGNFFRCVPELPRDVHDVGGLLEIGRFLFPDGDAAPGADAAPQGGE